MASKVAAVDAICRDQLMKAVMVEAGELRGRLMDICVSSHPQNVAFIDWVIVVSVLSKVGIVDLHDDDVDYWNLADPDGWTWDYEVDDDGRIIKLSIFDEEDLDPFDPFDLPAGIARLQRLTDLTVYNCRSLPVKELSSLPYFKKLRLLGCSDLLENFPAQMELKYLKKLYVSESQFRSSSPFLAWMAGGQLPSLDTLLFQGTRTNETSIILNILRNPDVCLQTNLKEFSMTHGELNENHLETLFLEVLPRFPNMNRLDLGWNQIQSIQSVVDRLKSDKTRFISKSIRHLGLYGNPVVSKMKKCLDLYGDPVMKKVKEDPKETTAVLSFLQTFNTVCNLGGLYNNDYDLDVKYALRINHAGRRIVEGNGDRPLPLSVWPIVLARSFEKSDHLCRPDLKRNHTGLYYLLRNGPALAGRVGLGSDGIGRLLSSNDDDDDAKEIPSKKRKTGENNKEGVAVAC